LAVSRLTIGRKRFAQRRARLRGEKAGHRVLAAGDDLAGIAEAHRFHRQHEQGLGLGNGGLGGAVHRRHELVDALLLAGELEHLRRFVEKPGQRDAHPRIAEEAIGTTEQLDRGRCAALERGADAEAASALLSASARAAPPWPASAANAASAENSRRRMHAPRRHRAVVAFSSCGAFSAPAGRSPRRRR